MKNRTSLLIAVTHISSNTFRKRQRSHQIEAEIERQLNPNRSKQIESGNTHTRLFTAEIYGLWIWRLNRRTHVGNELTGIHWLIAEGHASRVTKSGRCSMMHSKHKSEEKSSRDW
jgi:hypothetical protein